MMMPMVMVMVMTVTVVNTMVFGVVFYPGPLNVVVVAHLSRT